MQSALTPKEQLFISALVRNGGNKAAAAEAAGYSSPSVAAQRVIKRPHVLAVLRRRRQTKIETSLASTALAAIEELIVDKDISPAVRFQAARWALEAAGHGQKNPTTPSFDPEKPLAEMSLSELQAFITAGSQAIDTMKQPRLVNSSRPQTIDADGVDNDADSMAQHAGSFM